MLQLIIAFLILTVIIPGALSDCIWYGECNTDEIGRTQNCPYSGPSRLLNDTITIQILRDYCPHLIKEKDVSTCCDWKQLQTFKKKISVVVALVGRCPSCFRSFVGLLCDLMCHYNQSDFINVTSIVKNAKGIEYINEIDVYVDEKYMNSTYESCRQVIMPDTGQLVLDLMCGTWGSSKCNPRRFYNFIGMKSEQVPFTINFITSVKADSAYHLINPPSYPCSKPVDNTSVPCSCIDCEESCPSYSEYNNVNEDEFLILKCYLLPTAFFGMLLTVLVYKNFFVQILIKAKSTEVLENCNDPIKENEINSERNLSHNLEKSLTQFFTNIGENCALYPFKILILGGFLICCCMHGIQYISITVDPVELWTSSFSQCRVERQYFNEKFGPFYRIQQVVVTAKNLPNVIRNSSDGIREFGAVFHKQFLIDFKTLQDDILKLGGPKNGLQKICIAPLANDNENLKNSKKCFVQSVWGYFKNNLKLFERNGTNIDGSVNDYLDHITTCVQNSYNPSCFAEYGGPVDPALIFGAFLSPHETLSKSSNFMKANILVLTIVIKNHLNKTDLEPALKWELLFLDYMRNYTKNKKDTMDVSFFSERFIEDELNRESETNIPIVIISYLAMFLYIATVLGKFRFSSRILLESKIIVGFVGVLMILASVISSIGINSILGIKVTLITLEVVPFLVLAVGVDNIFILVHAFQTEKYKENESFEKHVGKILGKIGPTILLSGISESGCFFLGSLSTMPCIKAFAIYAAVSLLINFILQLTCFVSLLSLDYKRQMRNRLDVLCCFKMEVKDKPEFLLRTIFENYTSFILHQFVRPFILILFFIWLFINIFVLSRISLGFEQDIAMPSDSHILRYFNDLKNNLALGPPVYFVLTGDLDLTNVSNQNILCNGQYCEVNSVTNQIYAASRKPNKTYIAKSSTSWIDDYFAWFTSPGCCLIGSKPNEICEINDCQQCNITLQQNGRPSPNDFSMHLSQFLSQNPSLGCVKGGRAAYGNAVNYKIKQNSTEIGPYYFMTYHSVLKTSEDYYTALKEARFLADNMTKTIRSKTDTNIEVFPYSVFYIFYEQYLTIWQDSLKSILISLLTIFVIILFFTQGNLVISLITLLTVSMIVTDMMGLLYFLNIQLNALSLVNIVMSIGIAVEFCCHIISHYCKSVAKTRSCRAKEALNNVGPSVFSGITMTKFIGIFVLWFSKSEVFRIYFFQMYLGIVIIGAAHGLLFLPVLLSYLGSVPKENISDMKCSYDLVSSHIDENEEQFELKKKKEKN